MTEDITSRLDDPGSRRLGTFSYLPPMTQEQVRHQVEHMLVKGWACSVEHVDPARASSTYWYLWKLPMFGEWDPSAVIAAVDACRRAYPRDHVRVVGYDKRRQTQGLAFVVHRAEIS